MNTKRSKHLKKNDKKSQKPAVTKLFEIPSTEYNPVNKEIKK